MTKMTLEEWVDETTEGTEDPYRYLDWDVAAQEAISELLGERE